MSFSSLEFFCFSLASIALLRLTSPGFCKNVALLGINAGFTAAFVSSFDQLASLIGFVLLGYLAILAAQRVRLWAVIIVILGLFVWLKRYSIVSFLPEPSSLFLTIGLSYILFRILHLVIDVAQGVQERPPILTYFNYVFFFLSFVSGPIQRYDEFAEQVAHRPSAITVEEAHHTFGRIVRGYFLVILVSSVALALQTRMLPGFYSALGDGFSAKATAYYAICAASYLVYLYANFSGYMHIVIGIGRFAGFALPENFDHPLRSRDFRDFWARWHMTLSSWFKFYLFNPLLKTLTARWGGPNTQTYLGAVAFFVTFFVMGMWHGTTPPFAIYGLLLGFGISANYLWQWNLTRRMGAKNYKKLCNRSWYYQISRAATVGYFTIALTCLWIAPEWASAMLRANGLLVCLSALVAFSVLGAVAGSMFDLFVSWTVNRLDDRALGAAERKAVVRSGLLWLALGTGSCIVSIIFLCTGPLAVVHDKAPDLSPQIHVFVLGLTIILSSAAVSFGLFDPLFDRIVLQLSAPRHRLLLNSGWMALRVFTLLIFAMQMARNIPEFVYRAF